MATSINQVLAVNIQGVSSATAAADRTFTATRALRIFDMKAYKDSVAVGAAAATLSLANGANGISSVATPNPPVVNTIYRLGQEIAASTIDDAFMLIAAGGTLVFGVDTADTFDLTAFCYPE